MSDGKEQEELVPNIFEAGNPGVEGELAYLDSLDRIDPSQFADYLQWVNTDPVSRNIDLAKLDFSGMELFKPRGTKAAIRGGTLREVIPTYLLQLIAVTGGKEGPIGTQFIARPELENRGAEGWTSDALGEEKYRPEGAPGAVYKYRASTTEDGHFWPGRSLLTFTYDCAAYCRFCTRGRHVGGHLHTMGDEDVNATLDWVENTQEVDEIILSGGDPLMMKADTLDHVMDRLAFMLKNEKLKYVRVGTRVPIHNPRIMDERRFKALAKIKNLNLMLHMNHAYEMTTETIEVLDRLRGQLAVIRPQTVLLKGVNDSIGTMHDLQRSAVKQGLVPYYTFHNDPNSWADEYTVPLQDFIVDWQDMRRRGSGLMTSRLIADIGDADGSGRGKQSLAEGGAYDGDLLTIRDFDGKLFPNYGHHETR